ncbi:MAG: protein-disulfide reductase DsbD domain-containing protein [Pseudomonadales bacterium]
MKSLMNQFVRSTALLWVLVAASSVMASSLFEKLPWSKTTGLSRVLPVDQAFQFSSYRANGQLTLSWLITPGHYLYADRISLVGLGSEVSLNIEKPLGERHVDEYFGDVEIYRDNLELSVALSALSAAAPASGEWEVRYQGCADRGYCYPPQKRPLEITDD